MSNFENLVTQSWNNVSLFTRLVKNSDFIHELKTRTTFLDNHYIELM
jgi:hypothetical protein